MGAKFEITFRKQELFLRKCLHDENLVIAISLLVSTLPQDDSACGMTL